MIIEYTPAPRGSSGEDISVSMTYAELVAAIAANELVTGQTIVLTDFRTSQYIQYTDTPGNGTGNDELVHLGTIEPLILRASSNNTLDNVAYSPSKPQDVLEYAVVLPDRQYEYAAAGGRGVITKRTDRHNQNSRDYDFRNVIFRRWNDGAGLYTVVRKIDAPDPADFLDFFAYILAVRVTVSSPLSLNTALSTTYGVAIPYWLDNTVIKTGVTCQDNDLGISFANTFEDNTLVSHRTVTGNDFHIFLWNVLNLGTGTVNNDILSNVINAVVTNSTRGAVANNRINLLKSNLNTGILSDNVSDTIQNSAASVSDIRNNNVLTIDTNSNTGQIAYNVGRNISSNVSSVSNINANNVNDISSNASTGTINGNVGQRIVGNSNNGDIEFNSVREIQGNSNPGTIDRNTGNLIGGNASMGFIRNNNVNFLNANTCGNIFENTGYQIFANTITGTIQGNQVNYIYNNVETSASSINFCSGENIYDSTLAGTLLSCQLRIGNCLFDAICTDHNFIDGIDGRSIHPNADMQSNVYTRSVLDEGIGEYVQMIVAGGVITFSAAITT